MLSKKESSPSFWLYDCSCGGRWTHMQVGQILARASLGGWLGRRLSLAHGVGEAIVRRFINELYEPIVLGGLAQCRPGVGRR